MRGGAWHPGQDDGFLQPHIDRITATPATAEWEEQRKLLCAEAIDSFIDLADSIDTEGLTVAVGAIDGFADEIYTAPRSFVRRRNDIEAACEEIARAWPVV